MRNVLFLALSSCAACAVAGDGYLDASFGSGGRAAPLTPLADEQYGSGATAVMMQPDGKILIAGAVGDASNTAFLRVIRLLGDGTLDPSFGSAGIAQVNVGSVSASNSTFAPVKMARAADGSLFVTAMTGLVSASVTKLTPAGQPVVAFGSGGVSTAMQPPGGTQAFALADLGVSPSGAVLLVGTYRANSPSSLGTVRVVALNPTTGAVLATSTIGSETGDSAAAAVVQGTGFLVAGSGNNHCLLERVQYASGAFSTDTGFGSGTGRVEVSVASGTTRCRAVAVERDGTILYAGAINKPNQSQNVLVGRLLADGSPDMSYNSGMPFQAYFESSQPFYENYATAVLAQDDGKVLVAGTASPGPTATGRGNYDVGIMRFTAAGAYDGSFQGNTDGSQFATAMVGFEALSGHTSDDFGYALTLSSGRPLVVGYASSNGFDSPVRYVAARLDNDPVYKDGFE
jgi:uncharacterized delta-60 repeat protein